MDPKMEPIATYVFIDIGTQGRRDDNPDTIIAMSLLAVKSEDLRNITDETREEKIENPPIQHDRSFRQRNKEFDAEEEIIEFLKLLAEPVCLCAYRPFNYDFPALKSLLSHHGTPFLENIACVDTMAAFYDILEPESEKSSRAERLAGVFPWQCSRGVTGFMLEAVYHRELGNTLYYKSDDDARNYISTADFRNKAALRVAVKLSEEFPNWLENNRFTFAEVPLHKETKPAKPFESRFQAHIRL